MATGGGEAPPSSSLAPAVCTRRLSVWDGGGGRGEGRGVGCHVWATHRPPPHHSPVGLTCSHPWLACAFYTPSSVVLFTPSATTLTPLGSHLTLLNTGGGGPGLPPQGGSPLMGGPPSGQPGRGAATQASSSSHVFTLSPGVPLLAPLTSGFLR